MGVMYAVTYSKKISTRKLHCVSVDKLECKKTVTVGRFLALFNV